MSMRFMARIVNIIIDFLYDLPRSHPFLPTVISIISLLLVVIKIFLVDMHQ